MPVIANNQVHILKFQSFNLQLTVFRECSSNSLLY